MIHTWRSFSPMAIACAAILLLLPGCGRDLDQAERPSKISTPSSPVASGEPASESSRLSGAATARKIIRTAEIALEVADFHRAYDRISAIARHYRGFVTDSSSQADENVGTSGNITIKVPVNSFENAVKDICSRREELVSRDLKGEDVTEEYVDTEARLRNLKREEDRFLDVLKQAHRVSDILIVEKELARVRGEVERTTAHLLSLQRQSVLSTITVSLREKRQVPLPYRSAWSVLNVIKDAANALLVVMKALLTLLIWIGMFFPVWGTAWGISIWLSRRRKARAADAAKSK